MRIEDFSIHLRNGAGDGNPSDGLCLMQAVHWFSGADTVSDRPECASPALCALGLRLNDLAPSQERRDQLWPLVWKLLDSRDPTAEQQRVEHIVREVAHRIVAPLFDRIRPELAARLRAARTMKEISEAARAAAGAAWAAAAAVAAAAEAARAAAAAARAARAAAAAARAARAAAAAARAAAWAARAEVAAAAAEAAEAAEVAEAEAEAARAAEAEVAATAEAEAWAAAAAWEELRQIFIEAIALGRHGKADPVYARRATELQRVMQGAK